MSEFPIKATGAAIIIRPRETPDQKTSGGIILSGETINKRDHHGIYADVLAIGPEVGNCAVGEVILVNRFDCVPFPYKTEVLQFTTKEYVRAKVYDTNGELSTPVHT